VITLLLPMLLISTMVMCYPLVINFFVILSRHYRREMLHTDANTFVLIRDFSVCVSKMS
jgi:hypothetical protein